MLKVCNFCGNKNFSNKRGQYTYRRDGNYLIVNHVPCEQCEYCGEQYFEAQTLKKIEAGFDSIYLTGRKPAKTIQVPVEEFVDLAGT
jgi:YgiT-type zinc finger domain-containing protein